MVDPAPGSAKFDGSRARDYTEQSRIALAGYDACQELGACMLASTLGSGRPASILVVGAGGTGQDLVKVAQLEPAWHFMAVDPSAEMLDLARSAYAAASVEDRVRVRCGAVADLASYEKFDAALLVGVIHHIPEGDDKAGILSEIAQRLLPDAPLLIAGNRGVYRENELLLRAWRERWRQSGAAVEECDRRLAVITSGAEPPASEEALADLLEASGFGPPSLYFSSLFWGAWITRRNT